MSGLNIVLNCTAGPETCQFCGAEIPPNDDHECPIMNGEIEDERFVAGLVTQPGECLSAFEVGLLAAQSYADQQRAWNARTQQLAAALGCQLLRALERCVTVLEAFDGSLWPIEEQAAIEARAALALTPGDSEALERVRRDEFNRVFDAIEHKIKLNAQIDGSSIIALSEVVALRKESAR